MHEHRKHPLLCPAAFRQRVWRQLLIALLIAPFAHRLLHRFHCDGE